MNFFTQIGLCLENYPPRVLQDPTRATAAVALVLRAGAEEPEILFIRRAPHPADPWSGDFAFPGGRIDPQDPGPRAAAERETRAEVGLDLSEACFLGRLDDLAGAHLPIIVSCFVYQIEKPLPLRLSDEVADAYWIPISRLTDPRHHALSPVRFAGQSLERPAIRLLDSQHGVLWGITYRLINSFFETIEQPLPRPAAGRDPRRRD
ncbi:NUDIX hydrolase [Geoalkalibacter halelectricus]|uniref:NUDIX hydrolase n=1 Tax=Geoalkalibacter halelectricus TaxID=2847045 RepID=UPI00266F81AC|nr:CoA pyrophosphatase [Geoalkalibacter halelectricus]MDO3379623.1 CoA pyrophosphatase [Geoalkalibacter halelectricus]